MDVLEMMKHAADSNDTVAKDAALMMARNEIEKLRGCIRRIGNDVDFANVPK